MAGTTFDSSLARSAYSNMCIDLPCLTYYRNESDGSGNCQPGFIVDDGLANAKYPDYYLQSHGGIHGSELP